MFTKNENQTCVLFSFRRFSLKATEDIVSIQLFSCIVESEQRNKGRDLHNEVDEQRGGRVEREGANRGHVWERAQIEGGRLRGHGHEHGGCGLPQDPAHVLRVGFFRNFFGFLESLDDDENVVNADS